jgi:Fur family transcriptional regulator, ferric uptake regulator
MLCDSARVATGYLSPLQVPAHPSTNATWTQRRPVRIEPGGGCILSGVSKPLGTPVPVGTVSTVDDVFELLRAKGGRATSSRRILLETLFETQEHLTAEELAEAVQSRAPDVHISTVYRNLDELQRLGVVMHSHLGHGPATYQLAANAHAHFICEECGAMVEAPVELFTNLAKTVRTRLGFSIDPRHFAILGRCSSCIT